MNLAQALDMHKEEGTDFIKQAFNKILKEYIKLQKEKAKNTAIACSIIGLGVEIDEVYTVIATQTLPIETLTMGLVNNVTSKGMWLITATITIVEVGQLFYMYMTKQINGEQFCKRAAIKIASNVVGMLGATIGATVGATALGFIFPIVGTLIGGLIGGLLGCIVTSVATEQVSNYFFTREEVIS